MKKILSFLALALAFTACQNEPVESVSSNGLVDVVLTVDAPELGVTRADEDGQNGKNSAYGAIDFMNDDDWDNYDLRYILEVYAADDNGTGDPIYRERLVNCLDKYAPTSFALRLVPNRSYKFVVFADFVAEGNAELTEPADKLAIADLYYNTADLRNIKAITTETTWNAMNEVRDAYFVSENVLIDTTGLNKTLTLTRPFAKLRVIATDLDYITGYAAPGYVEIEYKNEKIYKSFNAVNGQLNADEMTGAELEYAYDVSKTIPYSEGYDAYSTNQTLFADYLFAREGQQTAVNFVMTVWEDDTKTKKIHEQNFSTQIPIQRNHLTTIIGDLLTTQANITVKIDDNFVDEFVKGWGDDNTTMIGTWGAGELNANGDYQFVVTGENDFLVTINGNAVSNGKLTPGDYVLAEDAENDEKLTFTVANLQANATTRVLTNVRVIGGDMNVALVGDVYAITLDLVLQFAENNDVRHAIYTYEGDVSCGEKKLAAPDVTATVEGNTVTVAWDAVEGATSYLVAMGDAEAVETEECSMVYENLEWETTYTFSVQAMGDDITSVVVKVEATTGEKPAIPTYKLYFNNVEGWAKVNVYGWYDNNDPLFGEWPGTEVTEKETIEGTDYFVYTLSDEFTGKTINILFNDGNGKQTADIKGVVVDQDNYFSNYVEPVKPSDTILYLKPNSNWTQANARFAAYFFDNGETWVDMVLVEGETDIYAVTVPAGYPSVIFCRMNPATTDNNWNDGVKWNQTDDLTVPTDGNNLYTVKEGTWDKGGGTWSVYTK